MAAYPEITSEGMRFLAALECSENVLFFAWPSDSAKDSVHEYRGLHMSFHSISLFSCAIFVSTLSVQASGADVRLLNESTDRSGKIKVAVFERVAKTAKSHFMDFAVQVPDDYVVVGGGVAGSANPGNFITASYPNSSLSAWLVSTKDHLIPNPAAIRAYAIGLKIQGMTRKELLENDIVWTSAQSSGTESHPDMTAFLPSGYAMIGGGMRIGWSGAGNLAYGMYPDTMLSWRARSKDHVVSSPANMEVFTIGIQKSIPSIGEIEVAITTDQELANGRSVARAAVKPGYALTGCGSLVEWNREGALLVKNHPISMRDTLACEAAAKDHIAPDAANVTAYALGITVAE